MKLAVAGKGGVGKTSLTAWLGDYLARRGEKVWLVDADTALSLGRACGLDPGELPEPLAAWRDIIEERIRGRGETMLNLNPEVGDLPAALSVPLPLSGQTAPGAQAGEERLLVMGALNGAGGGCACDANALPQRLATLLPPAIAPFLPRTSLALPRRASLEERQLSSGSVLGLPAAEQAQVDAFCLNVIQHFNALK